MSVKPYDKNGVMLSQKTLYKGDKVKVSYNGLLAQAGAESIYLHSGVGDNWENSSYIKMNAEEGVFAVDINIPAGKSLGICFKDSADNWDNNSSNNYIFKISTKSTRKTESEENDPEAAKSIKQKGRTSDKSIRTKAASLKKSKSNN